MTEVLRAVDTSVVDGVGGTAATVTELTTSFSYALSGVAPEVIQDLAIYPASVFASASLVRETAYSNADCVERVSSATDGSVIDANNAVYFHGTTLELGQPIGEFSTSTWTAACEGPFVESVTDFLPQLGGWRWSADPDDPRTWTGTETISRDDLSFWDQVDVSLTKNLVFSASPPPDWDLDGIPDTLDNCPTDWNPDQADTNANGIGDACDVQDECVRQVSTDAYATAFLSFIDPLVFNDEVFSYNVFVAWCADGQRAWLPRGDESVLLAREMDGSPVLDTLGFLLGMSFEPADEAPVAFSKENDDGSVTVEAEALWNMCVHPLELIDYVGAAGQVTKWAIKRHIRNVAGTPSFERMMDSLVKDELRLLKTLPGINSDLAAEAIRSTTAPLLAATINAIVVAALDGLSVDPKVCATTWAPVIVIDLFPNGTASGRYDGEESAAFQVDYRDCVGPCPIDKP